MFEYNNLKTTFYFNNEKLKIYETQLFSTNIKYYTINLYFTCL